MEGSEERPSPATWDTTVDPVAIRRIARITTEWMENLFMWEVLDHRRFQSENFMRNPH
jgi:hypothetical protein